MHCAELARRYPAIRVDPDPIFVRDGSIWTSVGVTAAIDLALALVEDDVGRPWPRRGAPLGHVPQTSGRASAIQHGLSLQDAEDRFGALHSWNERAQLQPALR